MKHTLNIQQPYFVKLEKWPFFCPSKTTINVEIVVSNFNAELPENRLNNCVNSLANNSGKSTRHEAAETAKPWVDMYFIGKVGDSVVKL